MSKKNKKEDEERTVDFISESVLKDEDDTLVPIGEPIEIQPQIVQSSEIKILASQFAKISGRRKESTAGFIYWAEKTFGKIAKLTVNEWRTKWNDFWSMPISTGKRK